MQYPTDCMMQNASFFTVLYGTMCDVAKHSHYCCK